MRIRLNRVIDLTMNILAIVSLGFTLYLLTWGFLESNAQPHPGSVEWLILTGME